MGEEMRIIYRSIEDSYGENVNKMKLFEKTSWKISSQKNRRIFLLRCKTEKNTPTFLNFKKHHV